MLSSFEPTVLPMHRFNNSDFAKDAVQTKLAHLPQALVETPDEMQAGLAALCRSMDTCFGYVGRYQTGRIGSISPSVEQLLGYSPAHFINGGMEELRRLVHPQDLTGIVLTLKAFCKAYHSRYAAGDFSQMPKSADYFFRIKHREGHWLPVAQRVFALQPFENGMPDLIFSIVDVNAAAVNDANGERGKERSRKERYRLEGIISAKPFG